MTFLLFGLIASICGALPPGAVNLSIVHTTINRGANEAYPVIFTAAIGELLVAFLALNFSMTIETFIHENLIVQYILTAVLFVVGTSLIVKKAKKANPTSQSKQQGALKGFLLAILNPPVFVFWILAFTYLHENFNLQLMGLVSTTVFFLGIFLGKLSTLWLYINLSKRLCQESCKLTQRFNQGIGILTIGIGVLQCVRIFS